MTLHAVLTAAKAGDPQAIAVLVNHALKPQGISAKVRIVGYGLFIRLEGETVPKQAALVPSLAESINALGQPSLRSITVGGHLAGNDMPVWSEWVQLSETTL